MLEVSCACCNSRTWLERRATWSPNPERMICLTASSCAAVGGGNGSRTNGGTPATLLALPCPMLPLVSRCEPAVALPVDDRENGPSKWIERVSEWRQQLERASDLARVWVVVDELECKSKSVSPQAG